jgi:triosephosphate isomerase
MAYTADPPSCKESKRVRTALIAGNWKMHKTVAEARALAEAVVAATAGGAVEVVLAPPFTALAAVSAIARPAGVGVAGQTMHAAGQGAFTGEISPVMLAELASHVILGHSERRTLFGETDAGVSQKAVAALAHGLVPIVCVGETTAQRDAGTTDEVVTAQLAGSLAGLPPAQGAGLVVAYEPVWAIGTGRACDAVEAGRVAALVRSWLAGRFGAGTAEAVRVLYGGSVTPANAAEILAQGDVDGALVGGASLDAAAFAAIARSAPGR